MEAELWQRLPEDLLSMVLARLPMRVLGKMRTVCKQWNYLLSSRDALQRIVPNWSLHSTPGFLIQFQWDLKDDVESWVMEGCGSDIYKVALNHIVADTGKSIFCCHRMGDRKDFSIGTPGTGNWRHLPLPPATLDYGFSGMAFDSSTRRCTLLLGNYIQWREGDDNRRIEMCIYDSESNAWTPVSMMVPQHIRPYGKGIYSKGKFHWVSFSPSPGQVIVAFNIADGLWTEIPLPGERLQFYPPTVLGEYNGQLVVVEVKGHHCVRLWKLNEAEKCEIWCELRTSGVTNLPLCVTVNSSGLIMIIDRKINVYIFNLKGELIVRKMKLPGLRTSQRPVRIFVLAF
jgi:hypothetical protein